MTTVRRANQGQANFGSGEIYVTRTDIPGSAPIRLGEVQEVNVEFSATTKELMGSKKFAIAVASGAMKITGKAKLAVFSASAIAQVMFGTTATQGEKRLVNDVTTVATSIDLSSQNWSDDLSVMDSNGLLLNRVTTSPNAGEYSVADGVYTFNIADVGNQVTINYEQTLTTSGSTIKVMNQLLGTNTIFSLRLYGRYGSFYRELKLFQCVSNKFTLDFKNEDFSIPDFEFSAFADAADNVFEFTETVVS